jgi:hypothetical protein
VSIQVAFTVRSGVDFRDVEGGDEREEIGLGAKSPVEKKKNSDWSGVCEC